MKNKLICSLTILVVLAACGSDKDKAAEQAQFETVQEGSAPGVTSTIHGPGETIPPMTGTNMDTTTAFTLNPNAVPPAQPVGGTIAGTFPDPTAASQPMTGTYRPPVTRSTPVRTAPSYQPPPTRSQPEPESPPPTDTTQSAPPPTDTTTTSTTPPPTQTAPPPPPQQQPKKDADDEEDDEEESEQTDTAPPPPVR